MSRTVYLSAEEYTKLWETYSQYSRRGVPDVDPGMRYVTVQGLSGPGTTFKNEYQRLCYEHNNPTLPVQITVVEGDGMIVYMPEKCRNTMAVDIIVTELKKKNSGHYSYNVGQHAQDIWNALKDMV